MNEETIFQDALSRPLEERAAFLEQVCVGLPELRAAVEALLDAHDKPDNLLDKSPVNFAQTAKSGSVDLELEDKSVGDCSLPNELPQSIPTHLYHPEAQSGAIIADRYTLVESIGEGGMGEVWVAKQTEPVKRKVALKLIKTGMDSKSVLARFEQERQALALMDHPNIARVLDGGMTPTGRPFFVMELVNGLQLMKFCDQWKLSPTERLELFVPICQAVQHAHQKGIVHRDLKPANILVTMIDGKPVPKVIDFGVAKAMSGKLTEETMSTQFGAVVGTLEYMSPEQAGFGYEDIDTRADIYSLGVILYEVLTGLRPIDATRLKKAALTEMIRIIREEEPSKPSTRLSTDDSLPSLSALRQIEPRKLMRLLRGELDCVVMKCLEKNRDRRYETANALARDIRRYLSDEEVEARPPSAGFRIARFLRRNKGRVIAASLLLLSMFAGLGAVVAVQMQANRALEAKNRELVVEQEKVEARNKELATEKSKVQARFELAQKAIATFHTGVSEDALLKQDQLRELRIKLLKQAADFYSQLDKVLADQPDTESRRALSNAYSQLGTLTMEIGSPPEAIELQQKALALRRELAVGSGSDELSATELMKSLQLVGSLQRQKGETANARKTLEEARTIGDGLMNASDSPDLRASVAQTTYVLASVFNQMGEASKAEDAYNRTIEILERLTKDQPAVNNYWGKLANAYSNLGLVMTNQGQAKKGLESYRNALRIHQKLADQTPLSRESQQALAIDYVNIGGIQQGAERLSSFRKALESFQKLVDAYPAVTDYQSGLAVVQNNVANLLADLGQDFEASQVHESALSIRQRLADANPQIPQLQRELSASLNNFGKLHARQGRFDIAFTMLDRSLAIREKLAADNPSASWARTLLGYSRSYRGWAKLKAEKTGEAAADFRKAIELFDNDKSVDSCIELSRVLALLSGMGDNALSGVTADESKVFTEQSVMALEQAIKQGWGRMDELKGSDFDAVRTRADFQKLLTELESKAEQAAKE
jgi:eukaryotic-like serine/threonine-protein kinase